MNEIMYIGAQKDKKIFLFYHDKHFDVISNQSRFFGKSNYCFQSMKAYETLLTIRAIMFVRNAEEKRALKELMMKLKNVHPVLLIVVTMRATRII
jgi:hypothetical protein